MRVAFLGGVPPALGGGGLERQMERTADALRSLGHEVVRVEALGADDPFDVLHAFRAELVLYELLPHWQRHRVPLVVSPVLGVAKGGERRLLSAAARLPAPVTSARMRRVALGSADAIVALTEDERSMVSGVFGAPADRVEVIPNGVDAVVPDTPGDGDVPEGPFLLLVGHINRRKGQAATLRALAGTIPVVVVGGVIGDETEAAEFAAAVQLANATWLGPIDDPARIRGLQAAATATALLSEAEGLPLTVLESLAAGTPAIVSDLPTHRELAANHPGWVRVVESAEEVPVAFAEFREAPPAGPLPQIPSWTDVAMRLVELYDRLASGPTSGVPAGP